MTITLAITGASGAILARATLARLERDARVEHIDLVASPHGMRVARDELALAEGTLEQFAGRLVGHSAAKTQVHDDRNIGANIASGSYRSQAMIVVPCSMGTLAAIAHGHADSLIERAADVALKEKRRLLLAVRESPFNRVHLRNLLAADEAGATIFPVMPAFYDQSATVGAVADQFAARLLDHCGLPQADAFQWQG
ncbi:MAG TPA: UbiX family flavin prenyltransferase [Terriglobales bacterium]|nr:UbiX family flavin prenyltransferase [Terriglobales bacterium]